MSEAPIDRCTVVPVPGKEFTFVLVEKETGEPFDVSGTIVEAFASGQCEGK